LTFSLDCDFPGGNIIVERIDGDDVFLRQDLRDTEGWWFHWAFRVRGAAGRELTFHFTNGDVLGGMGPAVSVDGGLGWEWAGTGGVVRDPEEKGVVFKSRIPAAETYFSFAIPYQGSDLKRFLARPSSAPIQTDILCHSQAGRPVQRLVLGPAQARHRLLFTSRHHSCESLACHVVEGILGQALAPGAEGQWWRENAAIAWIPFMDFDGVEQGDQGKNRRPHDHNRDYVEEIYPSVKALKAWAPAWGQGKMKVGFDFHCPYIRGRRDVMAHFVSSPDQANWARILKFSDILEKDLRGTLPYQTANNLPFGDDWNVMRSGASCQEWMGTLDGMELATTVEFPYDNVEGVPVTAEAARAFGKDMAGALRKFLEKG
jgi:hypothetical protein